MSPRFAAPWNEHKLHTREALDANSYRILSRYVSRGEAWAVKVLVDMAAKPAPAQETAPIRRVRRAVTATVLAATLAVTSSLTASAPTAGHERGGGTTAGAAAKPNNAARGFVGPIVPQEVHPPRRPLVVECVPYSSGDSVWAKAEERVTKVVGARAVGRVSMTNIAKTIAAARMPEGIDLNALPEQGCVPLPTKTVIGGLYDVMQNPASDPKLAADMQRLNDQATLADALNQNIPLRNIQDAMARMA